jgi:1,2-diacylglycerol 3-alpha-glucosyltransferase
LNLSWIWGSFMPMKRLSTLSLDRLPLLSCILTDIDDTLTRDGKLLPEAYDSLWRLKEAGFRVIPVTGRPAGWCDMIIRQWPVDAVVGENGAFVYYNDMYEGDVSSKGPYKIFLHPSAAAEDVGGRLREVEEEVLRQVPGVRRAKDQPFRIYDLAIDFREDEPRFGLDTAERVVEVSRRRGAKARISSIHVNIWFGAYDKLAMSLLFLKEKRGIERNEAKERVLFCGDSPNDEPMFAYFPLSCGVANVKEYLPLMSHPPAFVCEKSSGEGFAELADYLLRRE